MSEIENYIKTAREDHGASDEQIEKQLTEAGWNKADIEAALKHRNGLPPAPKPTGHQSAVRPKAKLSQLAQAMHHILLWFFTGSTTITISIVFATLFNGNDSTETLAAYVAVTLVTLTPYALFYVDFLRKFKSEPTITTGKVWSIITIIFHTVGAIAALITLIINLIVGPMPEIYVAAAVIAVLDIFVLTTYFTATFVSPSKSKIREIILYAFLPLVIILLSVIGVIALSKLGPAKHDDQLRGRMVKTVQGVRSYYLDHNNTLPAELSDITEKDTSGIDYDKLSSTSYKVCGTFKASSNGNYSPDYSYDSDSYVSDYSFRTKKRGYQCFTFRTTPVIDTSRYNID